MPQRQVLDNFPLRSMGCEGKFSDGTQPNGRWEGGVKLRDIEEYELVARRGPYLVTTGHGKCELT